MGSLRDLFGWCTNDIARPCVAMEFERLVLTSPAIDRYATTALLIEVLQVADGEVAVHILDEKDAPLLELLEQYQRGRFRRLASNILILSFARRLAALAAKYCRRADGGESTSQLVGALLETAANYPLARRRSKVSANIAWETEKLLARRLARERKQQIEEEAFAREIEQAFSASSSWDPIPGNDIEESLGEVDATLVLSQFESRGIIDTLERELIETTILYGWKLRECISAGLWDRADLSYKAAYHRLRRALKRIKDCIEVDDPSFADSARSKKDPKK